MTKHILTTLPPRRSIIFAMASVVPPVAMRSSTMTTLSPGFTASLCISSVAVPYSRAYSSEMVSLGSLPFLRTSMNPFPMAYATGVPKTNPRDSEPAMRSKSTPFRESTILSMDIRSPSGLLTMVVTSLNMIPGLGKSGMVVT